MEPVDSDELPPGEAHFSTIATEAPASCAAIAAASPQAPAPMTRISISGRMARRSHPCWSGAAGRRSTRLPHHCRHVVGPALWRCRQTRKSCGHGRVKRTGQRCDLIPQLGLAERIVGPAARAVDAYRSAAAVGEDYLDAGGPVLGPGLEVLVRH